MFKSYRRIREENQAKWWAAIFGLFIFIGGIFILWNNEGRINFGKLAEKSIPINHDSSISSENNLVALSGNLTSPELLGDPYFIPPKSYILLNRNVEMYAWNEETKTDENTDETLYTYESSWTNSPAESINFYDPTYENYYLPFESEQFLVEEVNVGGYKVNAKNIQFPLEKIFDLNSLNIENASPDKAPFEIIGSYLYIGYSSISNPEIGDLRINFDYVPQKNDVTAFGIIQENQLNPFPTEREDFYRVLFMTREEAIIFLGEEYKSQLWGSRIAGTSALWCALFLILNPLTILTSYIPIINKAGKWVVAGTSLFLASIISLIIISISIIAHNPLLFILILIIIVIIFYGIDKYTESKISISTDN